MKTLRMSVATIILFTLFVNCSTGNDRRPSWDTDTNVKLVGVKSDSADINRSFKTEHPLQDVKVCGELFKIQNDFFIRSQCRFGKSDMFYGVSKVPLDLLMKESQGSIWMKWAESAQSQSKKGDVKAPFICFVGRGNGDPCDKQSGSLIQRVRRFTSDENHFNSW